MRKRCNPPGRLDWALQDTQLACGIVCGVPVYGRRLCSGMASAPAASAYLALQVGSLGRQDPQEQGAWCDAVEVLQPGVRQHVRKGQWAGHSRRRTLKSPSDSSKTPRVFVDDWRLVVLHLSLQGSEMLPLAETE